MQVTSCQSLSLSLASCKLGTKLGASQLHKGVSAVHSAGPVLRIFYLLQPDTQVYDSPESACVTSARHDTGTADGVTLDTAWAASVGMKDPASGAQATPAGCVPG